MTCFNVDLVTRWPCDPMKNKSDNKNTSCRTQPELLDLFSCWWNHLAATLRFASQDRALRTQSIIGRQHLKFGVQKYPTMRADDCFILLAFYLELHLILLLLPLLNLHVK